MTDSNIVKSLLDNKEEEKTDSNIVDTLNQQPSDTQLKDFENQVINSSFTNVFKTESKFDDYVITLYLMKKLLILLHKILILLIIYLMI